jgi:hypothetical protein
MARTATISKSPTKISAIGKQKAEIKIAENKEKDRETTDNVTTGKRQRAEVGGRKAHKRAEIWKAESRN